MVKITDFQFMSTNGKNEIHCRQWIPAGAIKGIVQIIHGVAEYIERYHDFACFMAENGYLVAGDDHLGHGYTTNAEDLGWFGETDGWMTIVEDEKKLRDLLKGWYPAAPMVLLGHSMGSFMARTYLGLWPEDFDMCILSGTGWQPAIVCGAGHMMANREIKAHGTRYRSESLQNLAFGSYLNKIENPIGKNDWINRDENAIRQYDADPLCGFVGTAGLMRDMMQGLGIICRDGHMEKMNKALPVLFISGDADPVGAYGRGVKKTAARFRWVAMRDITVKLYPGARHEVLSELNRREVWQDVLSWIREKEA